MKVIIAGAGPAGSTCGYTLVKNGQECLIIDRKEFPRDKLCGGGLTPQTQVFIERVYPDIRYNYIETKAIKMFYRTKYICSFTINKGLKIVVRSEFDHILLKEYEKNGGRKITDTVTKIEEKDGLTYVYLSSGKVLSCDYLVGADGANSAVRKYLQPGFKRGLPLLEKTVTGTKPDDLRIYFDSRMKGGYLYKFPNPKGYVIGYGDRHTNPGTFDKLLTDYGLMPDAKTKGAYVLSYDELDYPFKKNIILVGDAGGYADSISGEGIYFAMKSGENAALSIIEDKDFKLLNQPLAEVIKKHKKMAHLFYRPLVLRLFIYLCKKPKWLERINRKVNKELSNENRQQ